MSVVANNFKRHFQEAMPADCLINVVTIPSERHQRRNAVPPRRLSHGKVLQHEETRRGTHPTIVKHLKHLGLVPRIDRRFMAYHMLKPKKSVQ